MAQPKRKTSKSKRNMRIRSHTKSYAAASTCSSCASPSLPHRVCPSCGSYNGRQVVSVTADA